MLICDVIVIDKEHILADLRIRVDITQQALRKHDLLFHALGLQMLGAYVMRPGGMDESAAQRVLDIGSDCGG